VDQGVSGVKILMLFGFVMLNMFCLIVKTEMQSATKEKHVFVCY